MKYAPVLITTVSRAPFLERLIESLQRCKMAEMTDVFISVDYPPNEKYVPGYMEVVKYLKTGINGFNKVKIYFQKENLGPHKNVHFLLNIVSKEYDCWIITEDDNIFMPNFLEYMNKGLELFENDESVFAITSANDAAPWKTHGSNVIKTCNVCAWGIGIWKDRYDKINTYLTNEQVLQYMASRKKMSMLRRTLRMTWCIFVLQILGNNKKPFYCEGKIIPMTDIMMSAYCCFENKYVVSPLKSLVYNMGFDGSGENMKKSKPYGCNDNLDVDEYFDFVVNEPLEMDYYNMYVTNKYVLRVSKRLYIKSYIVYLLYWITGKNKNRVEKILNKIRR